MLLKKYQIKYTPNSNGSVIFRTLTRVDFITNQIRFVSSFGKTSDGLKDLASSNSIYP
jgi:hypothetical protein